MIKIEVEDYCHNCLDFQADVTKPERMYHEDIEVVQIGDTVVRCEYRKRCAGIERHLKQHMKKE